jgi:hypothetical protein
MPPEENMNLRPREMFFSLVNSFIFREVPGRYPWKGRAGH